MGATFRTRGQAAALAVVERAVRTERPPHALLFSGPGRVGKTTLAFDLCAGLLCLAGDPADRPCRECVACRKVDGGSHPDVHRLLPEGAGQQIRIGQVQALAAELALLPLEGRWRVAIVEQAQRLNPDAQNALLKTLEEPPAGATIILAADEPAGLLPTVLSRCARLRLGPVAPAAIAELLAERHGVDPMRGEALARESGGMVGLALELATQPELLLARGRICRSLLDLLAADRRMRLAAAPALLADAAELAAASSSDEVGATAVDEMATDERGAGGRPPTRAAPAQRRAAAGQLLALWRGVARDLALAARGASTDLRQHDLIDELLDAGRRVDAAAATRFLERLDGISRAVDAYANPELALDTLLLEWPVASSRAVPVRAA